MTKKIFIILSVVLICTGFSLKSVFADARGNGAITKQDLFFLKAYKVDPEALYKNLVENGYINEKGTIQDKFAQISDYSEMSLDPAYEKRKKEIYDILQWYYNKRIKLKSQLIADSAFCTTKFNEKDFDSVAGYAESKFAIENVPYLKNIKIEPYIKMRVNTSGKRFPRGDAFIYGAGIQRGMLMDGLRFYAEVLAIEHIKEDSESSWSKDKDWRVGLDLWKTFGLHDLSFFWGEIWFNIGYIDTNFYIKDYQTLIFQSSEKIGIKLLSSWIMPYIPVEMSVNEHSFFWENYFRSGGGLRIMPWTLSENKWLKNVKIYAEYLDTVHTFKDDIPGDKPHDDFRIGIQMSFDWWN